MQDEYQGLDAREVEEGERRNTLGICGPRPVGPG